MGFLKHILFALLFTTAALADVTAWVKLSCTAHNGDGTTSACASSGGGVGAYNTLDGAINARAATLSDRLIIRCIPDGANPDTWSSTVDLSSYTTTVDNDYLVIRSDDPADKCVVTGALTYVGLITPATLHQEIYDLVFVTTTSGGGDWVYGINASGMSASSGAKLVLGGNSFLYQPAGSPETGRCFGMRLNGRDSASGHIIIAYNNFVEGWTGCNTDFSLGASIGDIGHSGITTTFYNNTLVNNRHGIQIVKYGSGTIKLRNNLAASSASTDYYKEGTSGTFVVADMMTSDATSPTSDGSASNTFVDSANGDLRLVTGSAAINAGLDLSGDSDFPFSIDYDGDTRSGSWDIGADEVVSASANFVILLTETIGY